MTKIPNQAVKRINIYLKKMKKTNRIDPTVDWRLFVQLVELDAQ